MTIKEKHIESSESFYDSIAPVYNSSLTDSDGKARKAISLLFKKNVHAGNVMDFGGGTGLDIAWMLENKYKVFFLEPSEGMRTQAKKNVLSSDNPVFIGDNTDFSTWSEANLPIDEKVAGVLANFAVLNCIEDPRLFFEKTSLLLDERGHIIVTIIDPRFGSIARSYSALTAIRLTMIGQIEMLNQHNGIYHSTFIHSINSIRKHAAKYFNLESCVPVSDSSFVVLIFRLK